MHIIIRYCSGSVIETSSFAKADDVHAFDVVVKRIIELNIKTQKCIITKDMQ